tara:strand:- start:2764 stop:3393 length:630 start_codon:yes stop_codon:yes gene_type:complete
MEDKKNVGVFETLSKVNVNDKTEKKGKFTYLSWAFAWSELMSVVPNATSKVYHDENTNMPYFASKAGVMVKVGVTANDIEHINYLPVMDFRNQAISSEEVTMMDINKAIMRCTVKAIALHGLGLYIYAGEDLPEVDESLVPELIEKLDMKVVTDVVAEPFVLKASHIKEWNGKIYGRDEIFIAGEKRALPKETIAKLKLNPKYDPKSSK